MILEEYIEVNLAADLIPHFENLGYEIPRYKPKKGKPRVKRGTKIIVKVSDLPEGSGVKITAVCDKCGNSKRLMYKDYLKYVHDGQYCCNHCNQENIQKTWNEKYGGHPMRTQETKDKIMQTTIERYGVNHVSRSPMIREKTKQTVLQRYNVPHVMQCEEVKQKQKETTRERYGVDSAAELDSVKEKTKNTNLKKYGVEYPIQLEKVQNKRKKTMLEKYGYEYSGQVPELIEKRLQTLYKNGKQKTSAQQKYVSDILGGVLNYPLSIYSLDIYMLEDKIDIEIDFGGHDLKVKTGKITKEEFEKREMIREKKIRSNDIRLIRLISPHDKLPSDEKIHEIYDFAKQYFNETNHTWINFYLEENKYRNAEHKEIEGSYFDFGKLRKIKKEEVA